jgi:ubiquinone/menaquinone biosynthesis C-methylase UbiE
MSHSLQRKPFEARSSITICAPRGKMNRHSIKLFLEYNRSVAMMILRKNAIGSFEVKRVYESKLFVDDYVPQLELQKPELAILEELRSELPNLRMLDIGVGAGRTTEHFAGLAKEYIGVDYSSAMIKACRLRFPLYRLEVADAMDLSLFDDAYFDFVMFSFNGIDSVEHQERLAILREIRRVTRKGGYFSFSTHNLDSWWQGYQFRFSKNPAKLSLSMYNFLLNRKVWRTIRRTTRKPQCAMIYHKYKNFLFRTYFITPSEQLKQLKDAGFSDTKAYDLANGKIVSDPTNMLDNWVYFLAKAK